MKTDREDEIVKAHGPVLLSKQKTFGWEVALFRTDSVKWFPIGH